MGGGRGHYSEVWPSPVIPGTPVHPPGQPETDKEDECTFLGQIFKSSMVILVTPMQIVTCSAVSSFPDFGLLGPRESFVIFTSVEVRDFYRGCGFFSIPDPGSNNNKK